MRKKFSMARRAGWGRRPFPPQPLEKIVRREVDQLDFVRFLEDVIRDRLADRDRGDLRDDVVEAFEVLDVDGRVDVDAGGQEILDVLPPLGVGRALGVRVGQFVDEDQLRVAGQGGFEVELGEHRAAAGDLPPRQKIKPHDEGLGLRGACGST